MSTSKYVVLNANDPHQLILRNVDVMDEVHTKETVTVTFKEKDGVRTVSKMELNAPESKGKTIKEMEKEVPSQEDEDTRLGVEPPTATKTIKK